MVGLNVGISKRDGVDQHCADHRDPRACFLFPGAEIVITGVQSELP